MHTDLGLLASIVLSTIQIDLISFERRQLRCLIVSNDAYLPITQWQVARRLGRRHYNSSPTFDKLRSTRKSHGTERKILIIQTNQATHLTRTKKLYEI